MMRVLYATFVRHNEERRGHGFYRSRSAASRWRNRVLKAGKKARVVMLVEDGEIVGFSCVCRRYTRRVKP